MNSLRIAEGIGALIGFFIFFGIPAMRILRRVGYSRWWVLLALLPLVNLVALWVFAFSRPWPIEERLAPEISSASPPSHA